MKNTRGNKRSEINHAKVNFLFYSIQLILGLFILFLHTGYAVSNENQHKHISYHHECLNAIVSCEIGHAEPKIEGDTLKVWFVGGGTDTGKSVRVTDPTITLEITTSRMAKKSLVLYPKPNELAEEKVGDCSFFEGKASWILKLKTFKATGKVNFKGAIRKIVIDYPKGFDPD